MAKTIKEINEKIKQGKAVVVTAEDGKVILNLPSNMSDPDIKSWKAENCLKIKDLREKSKLIQELDPDAN